MNANELADKLMSSLTMEYDCDKYMEQAATMLRQQQAEIEALKLKKVTEGEILNIYLCLTNGNKDLDLFEFAEEILKKAQE